ncbi:MAG: MBL fold metallo-hydrolase [Candidatus Zixiibacteriota bacterium]|nr:MAG: MBL fold metallo-hydrolase [candidate division Zixibacteria bacterium]HHI03560.1 MBL fold metallo-hydrolase [candidate division Zixibacteria bacterium]
MQTEIITVSPFEENCCLVWDEKDRIGVIIDPGDEDELIAEKIKKSGFQPKAILLTHGHGDHIGAVSPLKKKYNIPLYIGRDDAPMLQSPSANVSAIFGYEIVCPPADFLVDDEDVIKFGSLEFVVFSTPGHTRGGVCYFCENALFCGDTLFSGSVGRTDLPGGDYQQLIDSIDKKILCLPDEIVCYPGHGPITTVGAERKHNPFLSGRRFV